MGNFAARYAPEADNVLMRVRVTLKGRPIRSFVFNQEHVKIGRNPEADIFLDNPGVSRDHLQLERSRNGDYVMQDVGSANGTLINEMPATSTRINDQDVIQIGKFSLHVSYETDRRGLAEDEKGVLPTVEDGTMVLSTADLNKLIAKAQEAETDAASTQGGISNPYTAMTEKAAAVRQRWITTGVFAAGAIVGATAMYFIARFLKW